MRFELVLFDLDGTLVDSLPDIASALNRALARAGLEPLPLDVVRGLVGEGVLRLVEKALVVQGAARDAGAIAREVVSIYSEKPCVETYLYPGVVEVVAELHDRGAKLAVLTNKVGSVARALMAELRMEEAFDAIVGEGDGYARKPSPEAALALMKRFGATPQSTLMVGDGLPDLALARAAGCLSMGVTWGYTPPQVIEAQQPDFVIDVPGSLLTVV